MRKFRVSVLVFLSLVILGLGFLRDFFFKTINYQIQILYYQQEQRGIPERLNFIETWSIPELERTKWILTTVFAVLYLILSLLFINILFRDRKYIRFTLFAYLGVFLVAGIIYLSGTFFNRQEDTYEFARYLMGALQSPIMLMILVAAFKFEERGHWKFES